jgi:dUTP pyrophosphatase
MTCPCADCHVRHPNKTSEGNTMPINDPGVAAENDARVARIQASMANINTHPSEGTVYYRAEDNAYFRIGDLVKHRNSERKGKITGIKADGNLTVEIDGVIPRTEWPVKLVDRIGSPSTWNSRKGGPGCGGDSGPCDACEEKREQGIVRPTGQDRTWQDDAERMGRVGLGVNHRIGMQVQRLHPEAKPPTQATPGDAGYDLYATQDSIVHPGQRGMVGTGIAIAIPHGYGGFIKPRSGLAISYGINVLGGVIDAGYRGEVGVILHNTSTHTTFTVKRGDRIAQLVIQPVATLDITEVESFTEATERGNGGFGSTGA